MNKSHSSNALFALLGLCCFAHAAALARENSGVVREEEFDEDAGHLLDNEGHERVLLDGPEPDTELISPEALFDEAASEAVSIAASQNNAGGAAGAIENGWKGMESLRARDPGSLPAEVRKELRDAWKAGAEGREARLLEVLKTAPVFSLSAIQSMFCKSEAGYDGSVAKEVIFSFLHDGPFAVKHQTSASSAAHVAMQGLADMGLIQKKNFGKVGDTALDEKLRLAFKKEGNKVEAFEEILSTAYMFSIRDVLPAITTICTADLSKYQSRMYTD